MEMLKSTKKDQSVPILEATIVRIGGENGKEFPVANHYLGFAYAQFKHEPFRLCLWENEKTCVVFDEQVWLSFDDSEHSNFSTPSQRL